MSQSVGALSLLVRGYDEAIAYYVGRLGFELVADVALGAGKRWVLVAPVSGKGAQILLAQASGRAQIAAIGNQSGGRVFLFLHTDDFARDHATYCDRGVEFLEAPRQEAYGTVAVFRDIYGDMWDLIEFRR